MSGQAVGLQGTLVAARSATMNYPGVLVAAVALGCYSLVVGQLLLRPVRPMLLVTVGGLVVWFGVALLFLGTVLRQAAAA